METVLLTPLINNLVARLFLLEDEDNKLLEGFQGDVTFLRRELPMISSAIEGQLSGQQDHVLLLSDQQLRQIAHGMEDCIDHITYRVCWKQRPWYRKVGKFGKKKKSCIQLAKEMKQLRNELEEAHKRKERYSVSHLEPTQLPLSSPHCFVHAEDLVGPQVSLEELLKKLPAQAEAKQLKVIAIVGFCGLGKTVLAQNLYNSVVGTQFEIKAWVCAADKDPQKLLEEMLQELKMPAPSTSTDRQLSTVDIRNHLNEKRCFIVVDDMQLSSQWDTIKSIFPRDISTTIVVTTKFHSVAKFCSSPNGYMYEMGRLNDNHSKQLLLQEACLLEHMDCSPSDSKPILDVCDGQPLALSTLGKFLLSSRMEVPDWKRLCNLLRCNLRSNDSSLFNGLRLALIHEYSRLPNHAMKACLLYFAMFPTDHRIRAQRIMRQWIAEGFVEPATSKSDPAYENFEKLMDRSILHPIDARYNKIVKTCRTYGMMHEYVMIKSSSENFIADNEDLHSTKEEDNLQIRYTRRLSLRDSSTTDGSSLDLSLIRSLIVFGEAGCMLNFDKYQLLRILDLEDCTDLKYRHVKKICNLLLLKYLSLRGNFTSLPKEIGNLKLLETLDLRRTAVTILPKEVFKLPHLTHLFGRFNLPDKVIPSNCLLQRLEGFLVNKHKRYDKFMRHMKKLQRVKIWCESSATTTSLTNLQRAIQEFIRDEKDSNNDPRSLSIHFDAFSEEWLKDLEGQCYLSSLKLSGILQKLPVFVTRLRDLKELCLQSKKLTADLLTALATLKDLEYLKLIADELDDFVLQQDALPALVCLRFVLRSSRLPTMEKGALKKLKSLQLLCDGLDGLSGIEINNFTYLKEVVLDVGVGVTSSATIQNWQDAAENHPNKPKVTLLNAPDPTLGAPTNDDSATPVANENGAESQMLPNGSISTLTESSIASDVTAHS